EGRAADRDGRSPGRALPRKAHDADNRKKEERKEEEETLVRSDRQPPEAVEERVVETLVLTVGREGPAESRQLEGEPEAEGQRRPGGGGAPQSRASRPGEGGAGGCDGGEKGREEDQVASLRDDREARDEPGARREEHRAPPRPGRGVLSRPHAEERG